MLKCRKPNKEVKQKNGGLSGVGNGQLQMKSPPKLSVGFTYLYLFDSIFKEYSDPNFLRSDVTKLCCLFSGGVSAMVIAPLLKNISSQAVSERYSLLLSVTLRRSIFHDSIPPSRIYFVLHGLNISLQK